MARPDIAQHLAQWGLRRFDDEDSYEAWQRQSLSGDQLRRLQQAAQARREDAAAGADQEFYDVTASSGILPVLYSQRYGYYHMLGPAMVTVLEGRRVLDVGCGVGILTSWYAACFPDTMFLGIDRSRQSIEAAQRFAQSRHLTNVEFRHCEIPCDTLPGPQNTLPETFDTIVSSQALFQSERDPGLPSRNWSTFERDRDARQQHELEQRTGIGPRLDWLLQVLAPSGRFVLFEKAVHPGRRVLFQRALEARGCLPVMDPRLLPYSELGESLEEGPLYVVTRGSSSPAAAFSEHVPHDPQDSLYGCRGTRADFVYSGLPKNDVYSEAMAAREGERNGSCEIGRTGGGLGYVRFVIPGTFSGLLVGPMELQPRMVELVRQEFRQEHPDAPIEAQLAQLCPEQEHDSPGQAPLYENHCPAAEHVWRTLPDRVVLRQKTDEEADGRQRHIEYGRCAGDVHYLYWANTFDQRQIVMMDRERSSLLERYYAEAVEGSEQE